MIEMAVVSGKGGTGKTSLVAAFAALAREPVVADCDVDAADLHLLLQPAIEARESFSGRSIATIDRSRCTACGRCITACRFRALRPTSSDETAPLPVAARPVPIVDRMACTGCGLCRHVCPSAAVAMEPMIGGELYVSKTRVGPMAHARLGVAEDNSGKLVARVRETARRLAAETRRELVLIDGPPGIGCPVIASIVAVDLVVIVTEPTVAGRHDLDRVVELARHLGRRFAVCVNKWDLNDTLAARLADEAAAAGAEAVCRVRYDPATTAAQRAGRTLVEYAHDGAADDVRQCWQALLGALPTPGRSDALVRSDEIEGSHQG
jgi:MinD superfamily P-loop ATPase